MLRYTLQCRLDSTFNGVHWYDARWYDVIAARHQDQIRYWFAENDIGVDDRIALFLSIHEADALGEEFKRVAGGDYRVKTVELAPLRLVVNNNDDVKDSCQPR